MRLSKQRALAGAGLADDVEMPAAFLGIEHDGLARDAGADAKLLCVMVSWAEGSRSAVRTASWELVRAAPCFPQGAPGLHGVVVIVRG